MAKYGSEMKEEATRGQRPVVAISTMLTFLRETTDEEKRDMKRFNGQETHYSSVRFVRTSVVTLSRTPLEDETE